jgi:hypothetical protein
MKKKLLVVAHSFTFNNGVCVTWTPVKEDGKGHDLFDVTIEFSATDIVHSQHHGPASAHSSQHLLKWEIRDRKKGDI